MKFGMLIWLYKKPIELKLHVSRMAIKAEVGNFKNVF